MSTRLSRGRSTPEIRATLTLLYPCRCLCRGFEQITRITPRRRMTLQRSQIFFTDGWTFIEPRPSLVPVHDPAARQVVRRQLHQDPVPRQDPDVVHPHLPRDVGQHVVSVLELHPEHGVRERFGHRPFDLDRVLLRQAPGDPRFPGTSDSPTDETEPPPDGSGQPVYGGLASTVHLGRRPTRAQPACSWGSALRGLEQGQLEPFGHPEPLVAVPPRGQDWLG